MGYNMTMKNKKDEFKVLEDRDHVLQRPAIYIGAVDEATYDEYLLDEGKIELRKVSYVQGLMKIISEFLDNCIDEAIRTKFKFANKISVSFDDKMNSITISDNGRGIPVEQIGEEWKPALAWTRARAGTNFNDDDRMTIGMNGLGSMLGVCYSLDFVGTTCDGINKCVVQCTNNLETTKVKVAPSNKQGTSVTFIPDLKRFKLKAKDVFKENSIYKKLLYQRLLNLSVCYPEIQFKFDGKVLKGSNVKNVMKLFGDSFEFISNGQCHIGIFHNPDDDFRQFSCINGLKIQNGGTHIDLIVNEVVSTIREKLSRRYKNIKPGEIKSKLFVVVYGHNFENPKFDSQTKEKITNSTQEIRTFLNGIDLDKLGKQILKNSSIIDPIVEIFKIKQEYANRKAIESAITKKVVRSKKYMPPISKNTYLLLTEGQSARAGLSASLGRDEFGYFELRGVPISAEKCNLSKFLQNEEMKLLMQVLEIDLSKKKEDLAKMSITYDYVVLATDQDADGSHIRGILLSNFRKYVPHLLKEGKILQLQTPIIALLDKGTIVKYFFTIDAYNEWAKENKDSKLRVKYYKGLGSWSSDALSKLFEKEGLDKFLVPFVFDEQANDTIKNWFIGDAVEFRKMKIMNHNFSIAMV